MTPNASAFVLTVGADETRITVTTSTTSNACPAFTTCSFAYIAGTALTITTGAQNLIDCLRFSGWTGACAGQGTTCSLVINSDLSTAATYNTRITGCVPR